MKRAAFAFGTLAAATIALAQQTSPQPEPPTSTAPQEQTAPSPNASPRMSETDRQTLLTDCLRQVQAANPSVPEKDVKAYCEKQVNSYAPQ
ncbi:MAG: hypothetical protein JO299_17635 [Gammaproteobacteria bacterium]|nr:hypothetical protein [Gammaproteobacteria bacterium]